MTDRHLDPTAAAEAEIARLELANRTAFYLLMQLENHPGLAALTTGDPTGRTASWWQTARRYLGMLWCLYGQHCTGLDAARAVRARAERLSADERDAVLAIAGGSAPPTAPRAMSSLLEEMIRVDERLREGLDAVERVRAELAAALDRCTAELAAADQATRLGPGPRSELAGLRLRLDRLRRAALDDPLSRWTGERVDRREIDELAADCARVATEFAALDELRHRVPAELAELEDTLRRLEDCEWRAALGRAEAAVTIGHDTAQPAGRRRSPALRDAMVRARALAEMGDWAQVDRSLAELRTALPVALMIAFVAAERARRPVRARSELRALLGLYRVKAADRGGPGEQLDRAYRRADQLVADPRVDLAEARAAVEGYRHLVNGPVAQRTAAHRGEGVGRA